MRFNITQRIDETIAESYIKEKDIVDIWLENLAITGMFICFLLISYLFCLVWFYLEFPCMEMIFGRFLDFFAGGIN